MSPIDRIWDLAIIKSFFQCFTLNWKTSNEGHSFSGCFLHHCGYVGLHSTLARSIKFSEPQTGVYFGKSLKKGPDSSTLKILFVEESLSVSLGSDMFFVTFWALVLSPSSENDTVTKEWDLRKLTSQLFEAVKVSSFYFIYLFFLFFFLLLCYCYMFESLNAPVIVTNF